MRRGPIPLAFYLIPTAALLAVLPLILHGCSCGHDFDFHLVSWMEAAAQFKAGNLHPAWAASPAWNAGEPRFVFYPPFSWTLGALLGLLLPWAAVPIVYTWIAFTAAGFGMYSLARTLNASPHTSLFASAIYIANPYMLFTAYERTAYAELLAAAWIPLLLAAILRERVTPLRLAIPIALLWLTNAPAAVMGCYSLAVLAVLRLLWLWLAERGGSFITRAKACAAFAGQTFIGLGLGLGLAAFYILPAAYERRWVQIEMATIQGMRIEDNFLFHHTADALHDEVLRTASFIATMIFAATFVIFITVMVRPQRAAPTNRSQRAAVSLSILAMVIAVLLTPISASFWRLAPEMTFLQFPWRLTAILAAILCAGLALLIAPFNLRGAWPLISAGVIVPCILWPSAMAFTQACDEEDNVAARLAVFRSHLGTDPTDEYTTGSADNEALSHANPPFWLAADGEASAPATGEQPGSPARHLSLSTARDTILVLNLRNFPAWMVHVNGVVVRDRGERADGLITLPLHAGRSEIDISYVMTWDRKFGDGITFTALCVAIALFFHRPRSFAWRRVLQTLAYHRT